METLYRARNWFASGPSFLVLLIAIVMTGIHMPAPAKQKAQTEIRVTIAAPPVEEPTPPAPLPEVAPLQQVTPTVQPIQKLTPLPVLKTAPTPTPRPTPVEQPQAQPSAVAVSAPPMPAAHPAPAAPSSASQDDAYAAQVRAYLESIKHYPTSKEARLQRPRGTVDVWFVLDRSGGMKEAGVENSSGSLILDGAALATVRGASYPAFPADAFRGEATHRFTVHLNYTLT